MTGTVGDFVWCDLSAHRPDRAIDFYGKLFGWTFDGDTGKYSYALCGADPVGGLFDMPAFFRKIQMPSFWMSYMKVASVASAAETARSEGGKVELEEEFGEDGRIALIRDPLGAGFTVYEGPMTAGATGKHKPGLRAGHALHVSDASSIETFYHALFGWRVGDRDGGCQFTHSSGHPVADLYESPEEERGGFEYWGIAFTVSDLEIAAREVEALGGRVFSRTAWSQGTMIAVADMDGAAFFAMEAA